MFVLSLFLSATLASAQINEVVKQQLTLRGTVQAVDQTARTVTIRGTQGTVVTVDVPQTSVAFSQVQVGDVVSITYFDGVSVRPHAAGTPPIDRTDPPSATATGRRATRRDPRLFAGRDGHDHGLGSCPADSEFHRSRWRRLHPSSSRCERSQDHDGNQGRGPR